MIPALPGRRYQLTLGLAWKSQQAEGGSIDGRIASDTKSKRVGQTALSVATRNF